MYLISMEKKKKMRNPTNRERSYLELAKKVACNSDFKTFRHGAVLVKGGSVINIGYNKNQFNSFASRFRKIDKQYSTIHAEMASMLGVDVSKTGGAVIYVVRINNDFCFRYSKPCKKCQAMMKYCGVRKTVYSTNFGFKVEEIKL